MKLAHVWSLTLTVNGTDYSVDVAPHHTLLHLMRDVLELTGSKECCAEGECGACTVLIDGRSVNSCLMLAVEADGREITTVEGLASEGRLSPLQEAFLDEGAAQCGFCIPGQLMSATELLARNPDPSVDEVHDGLVGNLCRCAGYQQITAAVLAAAKAVDR